MKKKPGPGRPARPKPGQKKAARLAVVLGLATLALGVVLGVLAWWRSGKSAAEEAYVPRPRGQLTFNKDIAPIVFRHCAGCHRPGQSAPFAFSSYADVKKRTKQIAQVTAKRYMPPWLPEPGFGEFANDRRLTVDQLGLVQQWIAEGAVEG